MCWEKIFSPHSPTHNWRVHPPTRLTFSLVTFPVTAGGRAGDSCLDQFPRLYTRNGYDKLSMYSSPPPSLGFAKLPSSPSRGRKTPSLTYQKWGIRLVWVLLISLSFLTLPNSSSGEFQSRHDFEFPPQSPAQGNLGDSFAPARFASKAFNTCEHQVWIVSPFRIASK